MRKLIRMNQEYLVICDNPKCDYKIPNPTLDPNEDIVYLVNIPCPKCGESLLTEEDYKQSLVFMKIVNWANKWFSWLTIFYPEKKEKQAIAHIHKGVSFTYKDNKG